MNVVPRARSVNVLEIAKLSGSSKSAVSRVIQNQPGVAPEMRARIQHIIRAHHFQPSILGRALRGAHTGVIGVLARFMGSGFTAEVIRGIDDEVKRKGSQTMCMLAPGIDEYIRSWRTLVSGRHVDGVVLLAPPTDIFKYPVDELDKPVVLCAAEPPDKASTWKAAGSVVLDNQTAMKQMVKHLLDQGCRRLIYLAGQPDIFDCQERERVFLEAAAERKGVRASVVQGAWTRELAVSVVHGCLSARKQKPDAILCWNDYVAMGCLQALSELDIAVPEKIAVAGWDDVPGADHLDVTTIRLPMLEMGWQAARILFQKTNPGNVGLASPSHVSLQMSLQIRRTTVRRAVKSRA